MRFIRIIRFTCSMRFIRIIRFMFYALHTYNTSYVLCFVRLTCSMRFIRIIRFTCSMRFIRIIRFTCYMRFIRIIRFMFYALHTYNTFYVLCASYVLYVSCFISFICSMRFICFICFIYHYILEEMLLLSPRSAKFTVSFTLVISTYTTLLIDDQVFASTTLKKNSLSHTFNIYAFL